MDIRRTKRKLNSTWWGTIDRYILSTTLIIITLGIALLMAASPSVANRLGYESFYFVKRQLFYLVIGLAIIAAYSAMSIVTARRLAVFGFLACLLLLLIVEFHGYETKGARRWVRILGFSIQPSEVIKPFFAVLTAWLITRRTTEKGFLGYSFSILSLFLVATLVIRQPDLGMTISIIAIWFTQFVVGGLNLIFVFSGVISLVIGFVISYFSLDHVRKRVDTFLDTSSGDNYQTSKSLQAFENGGVLGTGPGQGEVKEILPDAHSDFIFSVAGEEFGLIFCLILISLYGFLILRCLYKASKENDLFIILALTGLSVQLFFQSAVNMGVAVNLLPNTGMTLPFISYGGSSMLSSSFAIGMILTFTKKKFG